MGRNEGEVRRRAVEVGFRGVLCSCEKVFKLCSLKPDACSSVWEMSSWDISSEAVLLKLSNCLCVSEQQNLVF